jgi:malonyl-CoA/methylmalonyl-CoA synthetase
MAVPTIYFRLLSEWKAGTPDLRTMRVFISGSAPLSENLFHRFEQTTGFRILERYGMTEAGMIASNSIEPSGRKPKSVGFPLPGVQIRVVSGKGQNVKPGEVGEVWIKGDNVFKGYWQMPEKTQEAFEQGWFKSSDLGYQDPEDRMRLYLVGRSKELIITGGYNVYPKEVENVLEGLEAVQEVAVIGLPDEDYGEKVAAVVAIKGEPGKTSSEEMIAFCKKHLAGYKCPKQVFFVDKLPRNAMGKIQKDLLQKRFTDPDSHV